LWCDAHERGRRAVAGSVADRDAELVGADGVGVKLGERWRDSSRNAELEAGRDTSAQWSVNVCPRWQVGLLSASAAVADKEDCGADVRGSRGKRSRDVIVGTRCRKPWW